MAIQNYAQIINGKVNIIIVDDSKVQDLVDLGVDIVDISELDPKPQTGWNYDGETFTPPVDTNTYVVIETDKTEIDADNVDIATLTITLKNSNDETIDFTGTKYMNVTDHGVIPTSFIDGVASVAFKTNVSKKYNFTNCFENLIDKTTLSIWAIV